MGTSAYADDEARHDGSSHKDVIGTSVVDTVQAVATDSAAHGNRGELIKGFGLWSLLGVAATIGGSWSTTAQAMYSFLPYGGPVVIIWGIIANGIGFLAIALSLGEMASAYPTSAGLIEWSFWLCTPRYRRLLAFLAGWFGALLVVFAVPACGTLIGVNVMSLASVFHPDLVVARWQVWLMIEFFILCWTLINIYGIRILPTVEKCILILFFGGFVIWTIVPISTADSFQPAKFVFTESTNESGFNGFVNFMIGSVALCGGLVGVDSVTHLCEEVANPSLDVPRAMWLSIVIGILSTLVVMIPMFFAIQDYDAVLAAITTSSPVMEIIQQTTNSKVAVAMLSLISILLMVAAGLQNFLTASRTIFAVGREGGLFWPRWSGRVSKRNVPEGAIVYTAVLSGSISCVYLGTVAGFNTFLGGIVVCGFIAYLIPLTSLILRKRRYDVHVPFSLGVWGWPINIFAAVYMLLLVGCSFIPFANDVTVAYINWNIALVPGLTILGLAMWFITGRKTFMKAREDALLAYTMGEMQ